MPNQDNVEEDAGSALAWSFGMERALSMVAMGMQTVNGSMLRIGLDRLIARAEMSPELAPAMPMLAAEAAQDGVLRCWEDICKNQSSPMHRDLIKQSTDMATNVALISSQKDGWGPLFAEEIVRMAARVAIRCAPMVKSIEGLTLSDCIPAASSFFFALMAYDRLTQIERPAPEISAEIGLMLASYEASASDPGIWRQCREITGVFFSDSADPTTRWPSSINCSKSSVEMATALADPVLVKEQASIPAASSGRARPRG